MEKNRELKQTTDGKWAVTDEDGWTVEYDTYEAAAYEYAISDWFADVSAFENAHFDMRNLTPHGLTIANNKAMKAVKDGWNRDYGDYLPIKPSRSSSHDVIVLSGRRAIIISCPLYESAWQAFNSQCPPGVSPTTWEESIYDMAILFVDFGSRLVKLGWTAGDLFDVPHDDKQGGIAWFIKGSPVVALGKTMVSTADGRIYRR
jgi:hypothetical protein